MTTIQNTDIQHHDYIWELLPWYVNERLNPQEWVEVEAHLSNCLLCQDEVARCRNFNQAVKSNQQEIWTPSAPHFAKILDNVNAFERRATTSKKSSGWLANWLPWLHNTPSPARFALGLQGALVLALATTLLYRGLVPTENYRTLSNPAPSSQSIGPQIRVVFAEDISEKEMRTLLLNVSSRLVGGPSSLGVYTIALESGHGDSASAKQALAQLRAHPKVRLAEIASATTE
jgi:hypothetical protein